MPHGLFGQPLDTPAARADTVEPAERHPALDEIARALPPSVRLGTSSWAFPGWAGVVWKDRPSGKPHAERDLARAGLPAYAGSPLHRTVGLDRAFYRTPPAAELRGLRAQVEAVPPPAFRFVVKAWQAITRPNADADGRTHGPTAALDAPNPRFLDADAAREEVLIPLIDGLGPALGPVVWQFPPLALGAAGTPPADGLLDRLAAFLARLPRLPRPEAPHACHAVELRNEELLAPPLAERYAAALAEADAAHGFAHHPTLPSVRDQASALAAAGRPIERMPALLVRWLLRRGLGYDEAKRRFQPFKELREPDPNTREQIADLCRLAAAAGMPGGVFVIANNKAEGSAPLSLQRLAKSIADREHPAAP